MKDEIRHKLRIKRKYFQNVRREAADCVMLDFFMTAYGAYDSFFIYNSFSTEASTKYIVNALLEAGKKVYLPRVEGEHIVAVPYFGGQNEMKTGAFGVEEPQGQAYDGQIDVTVVPLLAVNGRGYRIGYGKGFYDRYFKDRLTLKVGLGYAFQIEDFDEDEWDVPLDSFLCEKGIMIYGTDEKAKT